MVRQEADNQAIDRLLLIYEISSSVTSDWMSFDDSQKVDHLTEAIKIVKAEMLYCGDESIADCMAWEITEMRESLEFYQRAIGQVPCDGQMTLMI